ncbi:SusC/RagA family TonB-linked outer membrane protein [Bacteroidota bacterium]
MKKKLFLLGSLLGIGFQLLFAQGVNITGSVVESETNLPLIGVNIIIKGTTSGTVSDLDGNYTIMAPDQDAILVFSFLGFEQQEIPVSGQSTINVFMVETIEMLEEVMVIAYGTTRKASFTGSAAVVKADAINKIPVSSFEKALVGNIAGVQVSNTTGQPGSGTEIRIRGIGSFSASKEPLYVIDGVPVTSGSMNNTAGGLVTGNVMSALPSGDIENITVLKDAAAASLYGSRAANGVILITTKHGREGVTRYNLKTTFGISDFAVDNYKTVSGEDFLMLHRESMENYVASGRAPATFDVDQTMIDNGWVKPEEGFTDWYEELFRKGQTKNIELSATGGSEKTQFYISGSVFDQEGIAYKSDYLRYSGRVNVTHKMGKMFSVGLNMLNSYTDQNIVDGGTRYYDPFYNVSRNCFPTEGPYLPDGSYRPELQNGYYNVVRERELNETSAKLFRSLNTGFIEIRPFEFLTFRSTGNFDWLNNDDTRYGSPLSRSGEAEGGYVSLDNRKRISLTSSNLLSFDKTFYQDHHVKLIGVYEIESRRRIRYSTSGDGLPNESIRNIGATAIPTEADGYNMGSTMLSYASALDYDYKNRYYLSGSFRRDGSSKLGVDERWANFWSASGAWRLSSESFMQNLSFLDDLKIRASYGTNGTLPPGDYDHLALYSYDGTYNGEVAAFESSISNPKLTWEKNANFNLGLDVTVLKNFSASVEYFSRFTKDLLMNLPLAPSVGAGSTWVNVGEMENKGWEIDIRTTNINTSAFNWTSFLTFTTSDNKIVKLNKGEEIISDVYIRREGEPYYTFYLIPWAGVNPTNGAPEWYVVDGDGNITEEVTGDVSGATRSIVGKADPDFYGSIGNNLSYKGFDLSFLFNFSVGGQLFYHSGYKTWNDGNYNQYAVEQSSLDRWQKPGDIAEHPQRIWLGNNDSWTETSRSLVDNDFLRLKDITLSYTLPASLTKKILINSITVYAQATNYLTFASQDLCDPEQRASGLLNFEIPNTKTLSFGLEIGF